MNAIQIDAREFARLQKEAKPLLVDFWAPWCTYCRRISLAYDAVAQENQDKLAVAKINIDQEPDLARQEKIEVIPTLVLYREGKAVASITAPDSKAEIDTFIREHL